MSDGYVILNPGVGGSTMDETEITFGSAPTTRFRSRVQVGGDGANKLADVINTAPSGSDYGLVVRNIPTGTQASTVQVPGDPICEYGTVTLVGASTPTTVVSYTTSVGKTFYLLGFTATGDINATFSILINGSTKMVGRTTVASPNVDFDFKMATPVANAGEVIAVRVTHYAAGLQGNFDGTILGYEV
jgi:hypothetical protein